MHRSRRHWCLRRRVWPQELEPVSEQVPEWVPEWVQPLEWPVLLQQEQVHWRSQIHQ